MVDLARYFLAFTCDESCGQCTPCREGTGRMLEILERICNGEGRAEDLPRLEQLARVDRSRPRCAAWARPRPTRSSPRSATSGTSTSSTSSAGTAGPACARGWWSPPARTCARPAWRPTATCGSWARATSRTRTSWCARRCRCRPFAASPVSIPCEKSCRRGDLDENIAVRALKDAAIQFGGHAEARVPAAEGSEVGQGSGGASARVPTA